MRVAGPDKTSTCRSLSKRVCVWVDMLQSVSPPNAAYQNIAGYFLGGAPRARQPASGVPTASRAPSARMATRPGAEVPSARTPIPSSSQKPGNREGNARVPYARFMFTWPADSAAPREIVSGDVVFVHKSHGAMGSGTNRLVKATGVPQLNALLNEHVAGVTTLDLAGPGVARRIKEARVRDAYAAYIASYHVGDVAATSYNWQIYDEQRKAAEVTDLAEIDVSRDWQAVTTLSEWALDGVLISADDDELDVETPKDARHDGILLNVCIQGPTAMRNSSSQAERATADRGRMEKGMGPEGSAWALQVVDDKVLVQDKVFCGLFVREVTDKPDGTGTLLRYAFYYKLFSSRQAYAMAILNGEAGRAGFANLRRTNPAPFAQGPSEQEFRRLVSVWRVGTVMDNRSVAGGTPMVTLNVCVEPWPMWKPFSTAQTAPPPERRDVNWIRHEYGDQIGQSLVVTLKGPTGVDPATNQVKLVAELEVKKMNESKFRGAFDRLEEIDKLMSDANIGSLAKADTDLRAWLRDQSKPVPQSAARLVQALYGLSKEQSDFLYNLEDGTYDDVVEIAEKLTTVLRDKPAAKQLLTAPALAAVRDANKFLLMYSEFGGFRQLQERLEADADALDALLDA